MFNDGKHHFHLKEYSIPQLLYAGTWKTQWATAGDDTMQKYRERNTELHVVFVDLEKAYDRLPRELLWSSLRTKRVPEAYIKIVQDMYEDCLTQVTTREGNTEYFDVKVGD